MIENKKEVLKSLYRSLTQFPEQSKAYSCLVIMCNKTLEQLEQGNEELMTYSRRTLKIHVDGGPQAQACDSKELNRWIQHKNLIECLNRFIDNNRRNFESLGFVPEVKTNLDKKGGRGNETLFWLDVIANTTQTSTSDEDMAEESVWNPSIIYSRTPSQDIRIAFFLKPFFRRGQMLNKSLIGLIFWIPLCFGLLFITVLLSTLAISLVSLGQQISLLNLFLIIALMGVFTLFCKSVISPLFFLPEHRVIKAPALFLSLMEDDADIEMHRDQYKNQHTRFTRFEATCTVCGASVFLKTGKPDQSLPLVGRCSESPHAHVYSFDRVNLTGVLLNYWAIPTHNLYNTNTKQP